MAELYSLPDGWEWKKLGDIGKISTGKTPSKANKEFYENGTIRFIKPPNLQNSYNIQKAESDEFVTEDGAKKSTLLPKNTLMVCCIGSLGKFALSNEKVITNQQINSIIFYDDIINYKYGYYYGFKLEKLLNDVANEAVVKIVNKTIFSNLDIPLPPLEEQKRIVAKLDILFAKIDKAIALHQKNIDEADIFMASVLNDVFVELEEKYEKQKLSEIVIFGGKNISTLEYPNLIYFSLEDIEAQTGKILNFKTVNESGVKGTAVRFDDNVVLYSKLRPYLNKVIVPNLEGCATTELVVIKPKDKVDKYFLASYLRSSNIVNFLNNDSMGAKMPRTNMKTFRNLDISFPPLPTQQKVVSYLDEISNKMEKIKNLQKAKMQSLKELKASILDKAFKGEL
ncbi:MAG: restriction endonuclease subunit S [Aliarcobacter sp.]